MSTPTAGPEVSWSLTVRDASRSVRALVDRTSAVLLDAAEPSGTYSPAGGAAPVKAARVGAGLAVVARGSGPGRSW
ncbi:hypothetical protein [Micromonospora sp. AKA38]|uniref:hypothetical protein n=1 Tax=Micromonospora sp. AKA38 TaxID=2733861 RepID=UPI0022CA890F|nr:hypothetical protein [Micromonospora sp. AKA38]GHJ14281.1 hypothetical protein TPA0908_22760 [Micromonospora sp. AKA38]